MGLDIVALSKLRHVPNVPVDEDGDLITAFAYVGFEHSTRGLVNHDRVVDCGFGQFLCWEHYETTPESKQHRFRAGSYSGHTDFRRRLAETVGEQIETYWRDGSDPSLAFYELINFADNEGAIGPEAARDLLTDFRQWREMYGDLHPDDLDRYNDWTTACELAVEDGIILFG